MLHVLVYPQGNQAFLSCAPLCSSVRNGRRLSSSRLFIACERASVCARLVQGRLIAHHISCHGVNVTSTVRSDDSATVQLAHHLPCSFTFKRTKIKRSNPSPPHTQAAWKQFSSKQEEARKKSSILFYFAEASPIHLATREKKTLTVNNKFVTLSQF